MRAFLAFAACVLIWGTTWYAIEWQLGYVAKAWSLTYRFAIAAFLLFAWCAYRGLRLRYGRRDHLYFFGAGLFLFSGNYILTYWGISFLTSGLVAVTFSLLGLFNILNARLFLGTRADAKTLLAALLGVIGLVFIFLPEFQTLDANKTTSLGLMICIGSALVASWGNTVVSTKTAISLPLLPFNAWGMVYGTLVNLVFALIQGEAPSLDPRPEYYITLFYLSAFGTVIAFSLYLWLIAEIGVARAAYVAIVMPLVALSVSTVFEGYIWSGYAIAGVSLVLTGNIFMTISKSRRTKLPSPKSETN
jgi:drug/metabolite transporter (DMT)-like permease